MDGLECVGSNQEGKGEEVKIAKACGGRGSGNIAGRWVVWVGNSRVPGWVALAAGSCLVPHFCAFPGGDCRVISQHVMLREGRCGEHLENPVGLAGSVTSHSDYPLLTLYGSSTTRDSV